METGSTTTVSATTHILVIWVFPVSVKGPQFCGPGGFNPLAFRSLVGDESGVLRFGPRCL